MARGWTWELGVGRPEGQVWEAKVEMPIRQPGGDVSGPLDVRVWDSEERSGLEI